MIGTLLRYTLALTAGLMVAAGAATLATSAHVPPSRLWPVAAAFAAITAGGLWVSRERGAP